eukprot:2958659-Pyramimonas_sp.AAC.1
MRQRESRGWAEPSSSHDVAPPSQEDPARMSKTSAPSIVGQSLPPQSVIYCIIISVATRL